MLRFPEQRFGVICLANYGEINPTGLSKRVADIYLAEDFTEPAEERMEEYKIQLQEIPATLIENITGFYRNPKTGTIWDVSSKDGKLMVAVNDTSFQLVPTSLGQFYAAGIPYDIQVKFDPSAGSIPVRIEARIESNKPASFDRIAITSPPREALGEYAGEYFSQELDILYQLILEDEQLMVGHKGSPKEILKPLTPDSFKAAQFTLQLTRDNQSQITGFYLGAGRVKNLRFIKE
jgi:hypothetical protein